MSTSSNVSKMDELTNYVSNIQEDYERFLYGGSNRAAVRARKNLQVIKRVAQEVREEIQKKQNEKKQAQVNPDL